MRDTGWRWLWVSVIVVILDRFTKLLALKYLIPYQPHPVIPSFNLILVYNRGAAFSFLNHASGWQNLFLGCVAVMASIFILVWLHQISQKQYQLNIALTLILGGALGNLWDRFSRGHVIDFIQLYISRWSWPVFNIADSAISMGIVLLLWQWFKIEKGHSKHSR